MRLSCFSGMMRKFWNYREVVVIWWIIYFKRLIVCCVKFTSSFLNVCRGKEKPSRNFEFTMAWIWVSSWPHLTYGTLGKWVGHSRLQLYCLYDGEKEKSQSLWRTPRDCKQSPSLRPSTWWVHTEVSSLPLLHYQISDLPQRYGPSQTSMPLSKCIGRNLKVQKKH